MSNKSKQWCIDGTACVSIDPARIAFNMSAPFFLIAIFILKSSHRCMLFKHTNVQCHCASTISRIALKRYSKEHRYSTLFAIIWKSHVTSAKEKEKKTMWNAHTNNILEIFISRDDHVLNEWCALNAQILSGINHT